MPQVKPGTGPYKPATQPPQRLFTHYNMNHKHRGLALIFNHENFDNGASKRRGTNLDRDRLSRLLIDLGFQVKTRNDPTYADIHRIIQWIVKMDHSQNDCLIITVLTHGDLGMLYARDTIYNMKNLWRDFVDERCPTLAGKPKIFIIQACRGDRFDNGITLSKKVQSDGSSTSNTYPENPDFLFAFSTTPEFYSWRNTTDGSWFIQSLCEKMKEHANTKNILTWLTFVCQKVALDFNSNTPNDVNSHEKKQIPSIYSTLTRLLIFPVKEKETTDCCTQS